MNPREEKKLLTLYANLMDEVKVRIDMIDRAVQGQTQFPHPIVREFCYLQLRMLCELIGLSCLVAHGDIPATFSKQLGKETSADSIMKGLETLRPYFYPYAVKQSNFAIRSGVAHREHEALNPQPLPKASLLSLYGETHKHVHRGNVRKLLKSETPIDMNPMFQEIIGWAQKINDHFSCHIIPITEEKLIICILRNIDNNNRVQVAIGVSKKPE